MQMNRLPYLVLRSSLSRENHSEVGYRPGSGLEAPAGQALLNKQKGSHDLSGDECLLEGMWCEVTVQSGAEKRGEKHNRKLLLAFVLKGNSPPVCVLPRRLFLKQSIQAKTDAVAFCGSRAEHRMGYSGGTPVSRSFMNGHLSSRRGFLPHVS